MLRNIRLLYIHNFLTDFRLHSPFLVIYLAQISGSYTSAMAILALETVTSAVMDIPTGIFSDKIGRKYTLALGSVCAALALACYGLAHSIGLLLAAAPLHGLSMCLFNGNNDAMLYESLKAAGKENRFHHDQGRTSSMFQLALGLSAVGASFLTSYGLRFLFILGIVPQIFAALISLFMKEPRVHMHKGKDNLAHLKTAFAKLLSNRKLLLLMVGQAISWGAGESNYNFKSAFVNSLWPIWAVALFKAGNHALGFLGFWLAGPLIDRLKAVRLLMIAEIYWFLSQTLAVIMSNIISPLLLASGSCFFGPFMVSNGQLQQKHFSDEQRATMGSIASFAGSIVFAFAAFGIGFVADHFGLAAGVGFGVTLSVVSLPIYVWLFRRDF